MKNFLIFGLTVSSIFAYVFGALYFSDPLQLFHRSFITNEKVLQDNMRQQAAGIINNFDFDSVLLGTSLLENNSSKHVSEKLGGKFFNLSISGSDLFERRLVADYLFRKKNIRTIIFSIESETIIRRRIGNPKFPLEQFDYLYDSSRLNDFQVYLNDKYFGCAMFFSSDEKCVGSAVDLDRPYAWFKKKRNIQRFGGIDNWAPKGNRRIKKVLTTFVSQIEKVDVDEINLKVQRKNIDEQIAYLEENLISLVEGNSNTQFILIFPPYSRAKYSLMYNVDLTYLMHLKIMKYLALKSGDYPNLSVFSFEDKAFPDELSNYKDLIHYGEKFNQYMIEAISRGEGIIDNTNIDEFQEIILKKTQMHNIKEFGNELKAIL